MHPPCNPLRSTHQSSTHSANPSAAPSPTGNRRPSPPQPASRATTLASNHSTWRRTRAPSTPPTPKTRGAWTYLPYGPFESEAQYTAWLAERARGRDPSFYAVVDRTTNRALGALSYLRIDPPNGTIELGHLAYSPRLQQTRMSTEGPFLLMAHTFSLG